MARDDRTQRPHTRGLSFTRSVAGTRRLLSLIAACAIVAALISCHFLRAKPVDTRYSGAYVLENGDLVFISPRDDGRLRYRMMNGETATLWPLSDDTFEGGTGFSEREPASNRFIFGPDSAVWEAAGESRRLTRLPLRERIVSFSSGELTLRGKLVMPAGDGPHPVAVIVHGSEEYSAVDQYFEPYMYAVHGIAGFSYDKRGTGASSGRYLQNIHVLADDVISAVEWLRSQGDIDSAQVHLVGLSQGGWVAPLAAFRDGGIRSVLVNYGVAVPMVDEDRWGYVYALERAGMAEAEIGEADRVNAIIQDIFDRNVDRWSELANALRAARGETWLDAVRGSDSMLGFITGLRTQMWLVRIGMWWRFGRHDDPRFVDRLYDPGPTLEGLSTPSFWIMGGKDSSAPTPWTLEALKGHNDAGRPVDFCVFPDAEHGILSFEINASGERRILGYETDFFTIQVEWLLTGRNVCKY